MTDTRLIGGALVGVAVRDGESATAGGEPRGVGGERIVVGLYVAVVAVTGAMGALLGSAGAGDLRGVSPFGLVTIEPTPLGLATFGMLVVGSVLGAVLLAVAAVSRRYA